MSNLDEFRAAPCYDSRPRRWWRRFRAWWRRDGRIVLFGLSMWSLGAMFGLAIMAVAR